MFTPAKINERCYADFSPAFDLKLNIELVLISNDLHDLKSKVFTSECQQYNLITHKLVKLKSKIQHRHSQLNIPFINNPTGIGAISKM